MATANRVYFGTVRATAVLLTLAATAQAYTLTERLDVVTGANANTVTSVSPRFSRNDTDNTPRCSSCWRLLNNPHLSLTN